MILVCGLNHKTAPLPIREQCVLTQSNIHESLKSLAAHHGQQNVAILSTCNRTEIYAQQGDSANLLSWLEAHHCVKPGYFADYSYLYKSDEAVRHLLRVAAGLDSMVLGEPQILGQLKTAYRYAQEAGTLGTTLNRLFQYVFAVAKQIRTRTDIGRHPISLAYAAVQLVRSYFTDLSKQRVLLIGAGQTIALVARYLKNLQVMNLTIVNRDPLTAIKLAKPLNGQGVCLGALPCALQDADIVISAASVDSPLITSNMLMCEDSQYPLSTIKLLIDLGVPRNIEADCVQLAHIFLYTVDDLQSVIENNLTERQDAALHAQALIELHTDAFMTTLRRLNAVNTICTYREHTAVVCNSLLDQARHDLAQGKNSDDVLTELTYRLSNKLMHGPTQWIRSLGEQNDFDRLTALQDCFSLDMTDQTS